MDGEMGPGLRGADDVQADMFSARSQQFFSKALNGHRDQGFAGFNSSHLVKKEALYTYKNWA